MRYPILSSSLSLIIWILIIIFAAFFPDFSPKPTQQKPQPLNPLTPILKNPKIDL
jgi:hypothetical protein